MRILLLSPWMRTLARVRCEALRELGHDVVLVTTDQHYEKMSPRPYERVLDARPKDPRTLPAFLRTYRQLRNWRPDLVLTELVRDPRWLLLSALAPSIELIHDHEPHDHTEQVPLRRRLFADAFRRNALGTIAFSRTVADELRRQGRHAVVSIPLTSDVPDSAVPERDGKRRDFVLYGRMSPYKNIEVALAAWAEHQNSPAWQGDRLLLLGDGDVELGPLPAHCEWWRQRFSYPEILPVLVQAKASVVHYRTATQSGVQVLSHQLGLASIVSDVPGLVEYQPRPLPVVGVEDTAGLRAAFDQLANHSTAEHWGEIAQARYRAEHSALPAAQSLVRQCETLLAQRRP